MSANTTRTPGEWNFACDSYGKVQHSRKACVYTTVKGEGGDRIVTVAGRIENWKDARLIAQAPELLRLLKELQPILSNDGPLVKVYAHLDEQIEAVIKEAEGR